MVISAVILASLICFTLALSFMLERFLGWARLREKLDRHDVMNALMIAFGYLELGEPKGVHKALVEIKTILDGFHESIEEISVYRLIRRISEGLNYAERQVVYIESNVKELKLKTNLCMLSRVLTNLIKNAIEGTTDKIVNIDSRNDILVIANCATSRDCVSVLKNQGSTKDIKRGFGRQSTKQILDALGYGFSYEVDVKKSVIKAIIDFGEK